MKIPLYKHKRYQVTWGVVNSVKVKRVMNHVIMSRPIRVVMSKRLVKFKTTSLKAVTFGAMVLVASACSSGGSSSPATTESGAGAGAGAGPNNSAALAGTWGICSSGFLLGYQFTADRWKEVKGIFSSPDCTGPYEPDTGLHEFEFEGTYEIVGTSTSESGLPVMLINMSSDKLEGVALLESARLTRYNIVYTGTAGQLILGEFTQNESARATELDFDAPYLRR